MFDGGFFMADIEKYDLTIIGAGPAGLSAAIYASRAGLNFVVLETGIAGGQINNTYEIENYPGILTIGGSELGELLKKHALKFNAEIRNIQDCKIRIDNNKKFVDVKKYKASYTIETKAIIIATGAEFKKLGCEGEAEHIGQGVSFCAVCDGMFYKGLEIAVIGGGNTAVEEAEYLTKFASKVYLIHRRDKFRADQYVVDKTLANPKIVPVYNSVVEKIEGDGAVNSVVIKNVRDEKISRLNVSGVFIFVGNSPLNSCAGDLLKTDDNGWIITDEKMCTSIDGIYAAGDVRAKFLRQVITAASDGAVAAMAASEYVSRM